MLTKDQKRYLETISPSKVAKICPFDKKTQEIAKEMIQSIKLIYPNLEVKHMGASALGISGQNDLDIYALSKPKNFHKYLVGLIKLFGKPLHGHRTFIEWKFKKEGIDVEFYLTDPQSSTMRKQSRVFEILKKSPKLLKQYEDLKIKMNGKSFREYQTRKYEFFNNLLEQ